MLLPSRLGSAARQLGLFGVAATIVLGLAMLGTVPPAVADQTLSQIGGGGGGSYPGSGGSDTPVISGGGGGGSNNTMSQDSTGVDPSTSPPIAPEPTSQANSPVPSAGLHQGRFHTPDVEQNALETPPPQVSSQRATRWPSIRQPQRLASSHNSSRAPASHVSSPPSPSPASH